MKFTKGKNSDFYRQLNILVDAYFKNHRVTRFANIQIIVKGIILVSLYIASYSCLYFFPGNFKILIPSSILLGFSGVMIVFNLVHDASHQAISGNKKLNNLIRYFGDLVGINTYIWDIRHNIQHHTFTNVLGGDLIIENIPLLRLSEHQAYKKYHQYQPWYAPLLYLLYSFYWMFVIDFKLFFRKEICNLKNLKHPTKEWLKLFVFKSIYTGYILVLPIWLTSMSVAQVLMLFFIMHFAAGMLLSIVAVLGHFVEGPSFPQADNGKLENSWSEHELEATIDFSPSSLTMNWITGGLNTHVAHHLYPHICHVHYYHLSPIIEKFCRENGYPYKKESFTGALRSHFRYLKRLSHAPNVPVKVTDAVQPGKWERVKWKEGTWGIGN